MLIDAFQTGAAVAPRKRDGKILTKNRASNDSRLAALFKTFI
jgi:hypothetical protein